MFSLVIIKHVGSCPCLGVSHDSIELSNLDILSEGADMCSCMSSSNE